MSMMKNRKIIWGVSLICLLAIGAMAELMFTNWSLSSSYGRETIILPDGNKIHVILETWGSNRERLSITKNSCGCRPANPDTDYIDEFPILVYKVTDKGLIIYTEPGNNRIHEPKIEWANNRPTIIETRETEMFYKPQKFGVTILRIHENQWCFINLFRRSSSLRPM
jgi:hypothetical protein